MAIGMGVIGWTEEQTLNTTLPAIVLAHKGRCDFARSLLEAIYGKPKDADGKSGPIKNTRENMALMKASLLAMQPVNSQAS